MQLVFCNIATKWVEGPCCAFYNPHETWLQQIRLLAGLNKGGKTRNIAIQSSAAMLQNELHVIVARFTEA